MCIMHLLHAQQIVSVLGQRKSGQNVGKAEWRPNPEGRRFDTPLAQDTFCSRLSVREVKQQEREESATLTQHFPPPQKKTKTKLLPLSPPRSLSPNDLNTYVRGRP